MSRPLVRLATLVAADATGVLWLSGGDELPRLRIELVRGWVHALLSVASPAGPDELAAAVRLARSSRDRRAPETVLADALADVAHLEAAAVVEADEPRARIGSVTPFHPLGALRTAARAALTRFRHEHEGDGVPPGWPRVHDEAALALGAPVHPSAIAPDEQRAVQLLSLGAADGAPPIRMEHLRARAGCAPSRLDALLAELAALGSLLVDGVRAQVDLVRLAGEHARAQAEAAARRRAYHAAARQTHPDLHPDADEETRRRLTHEMAELAARRRRERDDE